jgi:hypothetical protein
MVEDRSMELAEELLRLRSGLTQEQQDQMDGRIFKLPRDMVPEPPVLNDRTLLALESWLALDRGERDEMNAVIDEISAMHRSPDPLGELVS